MTAFSPDDLPTGIDTVEKLAVWSLNLLNHLNPTTTTLEGENPGDASTVRSCQFSQFFMWLAPESFKWQIITRLSVELSPNWQKGVRKIWEYVLEINTAPIPPAFTKAVGE